MPKLLQPILIVASLIFYYLLTPEYLLLLVVSIIFNYIIGYLLIQKRSAYILWVGVIGDIGLLGYYKYFNFTVFNLNQFGFDIHTGSILLPLGISFFTFTQLAFIIDAYRGNVKSVSAISYIQFVTFFPHFVAGPIYHHADMIPQFEDKTKGAINWTNMHLGTSFFFVGLFKKVVIADTLALIVTPIFTVISHGGITGFTESWFGILAYTFQIYFDFSGYCDMAVGIALMFNIQFPANFYSPYRVTSIIDFWRCWNITLSNFLRDYLYIPLGGNRRGFVIQIINILITMLLGGLWHGAAWTFVIWGGLHGSYIALNHTWRSTGIVLNKYLVWAITFVAVVFAWVFFRVDGIDSARVMIRGMMGLSGNGWFLSGVNFKFAVFIILISAGIAFLLPNIIEITTGYTRTILNKKQVSVALINPFRISLQYKITPLWCLFLVIISVVSIVYVQTTSEFLYFQF